MERGSFARRTAEYSVHDEGAFPVAYREALALTNAAIDPEVVRSKDPHALRSRAELRLARLRRLLASLGDPHRAYPVIHVTGTSGKGSTALLAASILSAAGLRTGLHLSPYLQVATEKAQIHGRMITADELLELVRAVIAASERAGIAPVSYGEIWFAVATLAFARGGVDAAVIEVGAGGRFDLTNVVEPAVAVITSVGYDHMETLGSTLTEIAWHKAGIIKPGRPAVTAVSDGEARPVIEREAETAWSALTTVSEGSTYDVRPTGNGYVEWWNRDDPSTIFPTAMPGRFQATNAALALAAIRLAFPELELSEDVIRRGIAQARMPGRFEIVQRRPFVVLDGAHNPEKMTAFASALGSWLSSQSAGRVVGVIGSLEAKAVGEMLPPLLAHLGALVCTRPDVLAKRTAEPAALAGAARALQFAGTIDIVERGRDAVLRAIELAGVHGVVVVTGSLYLVGNVRGLWYPDDEVLLARNSWPAESFPAK